MDKRRDGESNIELLRILAIKKKLNCKPQADACGFLMSCFDYARLLT